MEYINIIVGEYMEDKIKISFYINEKTHYKVKRMALDQKTSASALYNKWIDEGVLKEEKQTTLD